MIHYVQTKETKIYITISLTLSVFIIYKHCEYLMSFWFVASCRMGRTKLYVRVRSLKLQKKNPTPVDDLTKAINNLEINWKDILYFGLRCSYAARISYKYIMGIGRKRSVARGFRGHLYEKWMIENGVHGWDSKRG